MKENPQMPQIDADERPERFEAPCPPASFVSRSEVRVPGFLQLRTPNSSFLTSFRSVFTRVYPCCFILLLSFTSCAAIEPAKPPRVEVPGEKTLAIEAAELGLIADDPAVQLFHAGNAVVLCDAAGIGMAGMFAPPPPDVLARAKMLAPGASLGEAGYTAIGLFADPERHVNIAWKGFTIAAHSNRVGTPNFVTRYNDFGVPRRVVDVSPFSPGETLFLDARGRLLTLNAEAIGEYVKARRAPPPFRLTPSENPLIVIVTAKGQIVAELLEDAAPRCVAAFLAAVEDGAFTDDALFYRVCPYSTQDGGEHLRIAQFGTRSTSEDFSVAVDTGTGVHARGTLAMLADNGRTDAKSAFFNLHDGLVDSWRDRYPVFGQIYRPDPRTDGATFAGPETEAAGDASLAVLDALRPGDRILQIRVLRQRRMSYRELAARYGATEGR